MAYHTEYFCQIKRFSPTFHHIIRAFILAFPLLMTLIFPICPTSSAEAPAPPRDSGWIHMPAGAKSAYMGIQGGTMPISLLVANDGSALLSFVGKTGNDFLSTLAKGNFNMPSFGNGTFSAKTATKTGLFAGNATTSLPIFTTSGPAGEWLNHLAPFGFSVSPLPIEGQPDIPPASPRARKYKTFYLPGSLKTLK